MKKTCVFFLGVLIMAAMTFAAGPFSLSVQGGFLFPNDSVYKDIYGSSHFMVGAKADFFLGEQIYLWAAFDHTGATGTTPVLLAETESDQNYLSGGLGYDRDLSDKMSLFGELGLLYADYSEKAFGVEVSGSAMGIRLGAGLRYYISSKLFAGFNLGYLYAKDDLDGIDVKLGGLYSGLGLGVRF